MKSRKKEVYDEKYMLTSVQSSFMDFFKASHNFKLSLEQLGGKAPKEAVKKLLKMGNNDLYSCYNNYIDSSPLHPEVNRTVILNDLVRLKDMAFEDGDTALLMKVIPEINKMIKGNLAASDKSSGDRTTIVGIIDLTSRDEVKQIGEGKVIDITSK